MPWPLFNIIDAAFIKYSLLTARRSASGQSDDDRVWNMKRFLKILEDSKGATAIEYGLIAALIAVAAISSMSFVGQELEIMFSDVATQLEAANTE